MKQVPSSLIEAESSVPNTLIEGCESFTLPKEGICPLSLRYKTTPCWLFKSVLAFFSISEWQNLDKFTFSNIVGGDIYLFCLLLEIFVPCLNLFPRSTFLHTYSSEEYQGGFNKLYIITVRNCHYFQELETVQKDTSNAVNSTIQNLALLSVSKVRNNV